MAIATETRHYEYSMKGATHENWSVATPLMASSACGDSMPFDVFASLPLDEDCGGVEGNMGGDFDYGLFQPLSSSLITAAPSFLTSPSIASTYTADYAGISNNSACTNSAFGCASSYVGDSELENFTSLVKKEHNSAGDLSSTTTSSQSDVCRELILRHLVRDIDATCSELGIASNPILWTADDCVRWVEEMCEQFHLPIPPSTAYLLSTGGGRALLAMSVNEFCVRVGTDAGNTLHTQLQLWKSASDSANGQAQQSDDTAVSAYSNSYAAWERSCEPASSSSVISIDHGSKRNYALNSTENDWRGDSFNIDTRPKEFELSSNSSCISAEHEPINDEFLNEFSGFFGAQHSCVNVQYLHQQRQQQRLHNEQRNGYGQQEQFYTDDKNDNGSNNNNYLTTLFAVDQRKLSNFGTTMNYYNEKKESNICSSFVPASGSGTASYKPYDAGASERLAFGGRSQVALCDNGRDASAFITPTMDGTSLPTPTMRTTSTDTSAAIGVVAAAAAAASGTIHLWHFIRELLDQPLEYGSCVRWVNRNEGTFKIESSHNLARIWGQRKNRSQMNYDKLSRSLRQYYKKGIIQKPEKKQRLVYKFLPPYNL